MTVSAERAGIGRRAALVAFASMGWDWPSPARAGPGPFATYEVAPGLYVRQGVHEDATAANDDAIANIGFIVGDDAVAVIDPGGSRSDGQRLRASIRAVTDLPIRFVVLSHMHPDHVFGCIAFTDDAPVFIAHANMLPALVSRGEYYRRELIDILGLDEAGDYAKPSLAVTDVQTIDLGNRVLELRAHGTAHTDNDLSVVDRVTGTLWASDLLFVDRVPALDGDLVGWLHELEVLKALPCTRAVPGHGPPSVPWPAGAADEQRYLTKLLNEIREMIAKGVNIEDAVDHVAASERGRWKLFDDYNGRNVTVAFKALEWE
jgi:quinoprotein relay system zinc metallohydrolase 2